VNTHSTRPLVESALLAALGAVMILIAWYVPVIGVVVGLVSPLPAAVAVIRHGIRWGLMSSIVTMLVLVPMVGLTVAIALWVVNGAMGISFGYAVRRNLSASMVLLTAAGGSLVATIAEFASAYFLMGLTLDKQLDEVITAWNQALEMNRKLLGPNPVLDQFASLMPTKELMLRAMPAILILTAFVLAYINFELFRRILPRLGYTLLGLPPFSEWIFPEAVGHAGILGFIALELQAYYNAPLLARAVENVYMVVSILCVVEALAFLAFYLLRYGIPRFMVGALMFLAVSILFGSGPLALLATLFGMIDMLFDFRHIRFEPVGEI